MTTTSWQQTLEVTATFIFGRVAPSTGHHADFYCAVIHFQGKWSCSLFMCWEKSSKKNAVLEMVTEQ